MGEVEGVVVEAGVIGAVAVTLTLQMFTVVKTPEFLDSIYVVGRSQEMRKLMGSVVQDLNLCLEAGIL